MESGSDAQRETQLHSLLVSLTQTVNDLSDARRELVTVLQAEHRGKVEQLTFADPGMSERAKESLGKVHTMDFALDSLKLKSEVAQLETQRDYYTLLVDICRSDLWPTVVGL